MRGLRTLVSMTTSALAIAGCASFAHERPAALHVQPVRSVRNGVDAEALYRMGRYFLGQMRYEQAIDSFRQVLVVNPNHADAHNGLGVVYARQGRAELAEREFRAALAIAPDNARIHNNLGYHLMMIGRLEEALASLERARALEPDNAMVAANIATAREKLRLPSDAQRTALAEVPAVTQAAAPTRVPAPEPTMRLDRLSEGVWELRSTSNSIAERDAYRVEISNGNGATGLAGRVSNLLAPRGIKRPRLTNDKPYGVVTSRIQYVAGAEQAAREINSSLPVHLPLARVPDLERSMHVRVLLGKDFPRDRMLARGGAQAPTQLAIVGPSTEQRLEQEF